MAELEELKNIEQQLVLAVRRGQPYSHVVAVIRKLATEERVKNKLSTFHSNDEALRYIRELVNEQHA